MKKILLITYIILANFLGFGQCPTLNENCESGKGIITDQRDTKNPNCPNMENNLMSKF